MGLATLSLAFWLFQERTGLLGNTVGWPVLSIAIACLVVAAASARSLIGRVAFPGAGWIATMSYSLYLSHKLVFHAVDSHLGYWLEGRGLLAFMIYALATLLGGALLHYIVERPFLRLRDRHEGRGHHATGQADSSAVPAR